MDQNAMNDGAGPTERCGSPSSGPGPPGSALAILLARQGADVTLFDDGRRPELLVGESLVPAVVPILQRLGIEEETATLQPRQAGRVLHLVADRPGQRHLRALRPRRLPLRLQRPAPALRRGLARPGDRLRSAPRAHAERSCSRCPRHGTDAELALAPETLAAAPASGAPARPHRGRHRTRAPRGPRAGDSRAARAAEGRRALRPLRGLPLGRRAGTGAHRARRGGLELVHSAPGAALDRDRAGPGRRGPPRTHSGRAARSRHRDRPLALLRRRRRQAGDRTWRPTPTTS